MVQQSLGLGVRGGQGFYVELVVQGVEELKVVGWSYYDGIIFNLFFGSSRGIRFY